MAICLPGMASRVKRAPTSATRSAPLVTTTNWMTTRIRNTTAPMIKEPPTVTLPNASITCPAKPCPSTNRVDATLSPSRNRVATSSSDGNTEKSRGFFTNMLVSRIRSASRMLQTIRKSSSGAGSGTTRSRTIPTMPTGTDSRANLLFFMTANLPSCDGFHGQRRAS